MSTNCVSCGFGERMCGSLKCEKCAALSRTSSTFGSVSPCDLGDGEWDHDWEEKYDDVGECDGHPGQEWRWRECRACGITKDEFKKQNIEVSRHGK